MEPEKKTNIIKIVGGPTRRQLFEKFQLRKRIQFEIIEGGVRKVIYAKLDSLDYTYKDNPSDCLKLTGQICPEQIFSEASYNTAEKNGNFVI